MKKVGWLFALSFLVAPVAAQRPGPGPIPVPSFTCKATNGGVELEWSYVFFAPIQAYVLARDGEVLTKLPPEATTYFDQGVPPGAHAYAISAINFDGSLLALDKCEVRVPDSGLRCKTEENKVHLEWGPILIDVAISKFRIARDGETIATVPPNQLSYTDQVFAVGSFAYAVHAVTSPNSELLIGECKVGIRCFGLKTAVDGLKVSLAWEGTPVLGPQAVTFIVTRDDELIAKTEKPEYVDEVPGPGLYLYQVHEDFGPRLPPVRIVGTCHVSVPRPGLPSPQDLVCAVVLLPEPIDPQPLDPAVIGSRDLEPTPIDLDGDGLVDSPLPRIAIDLNWRNPVPYDKIVIARNGSIVATLEGTATHYRDRVRGGGTFHYLVHGTRGNQKSDPAACKVEAPPVVVPPPQDLKCEVIRAVLDPADPKNPLPVDPTTDVIISPLTVVALTWWNPVKYTKLLVLRDGAELATLPGDAMGHRDVNPPEGKHVYAVHGVVADGRRSPASRCEVEIGGGGPVPPVIDLQCEVTQPTNQAPTGSVILVWENADAYDKILIYRNGELIFEDTGELRKYRDVGLEPGVYTYCVAAAKGGRLSERRCCQVVVNGVPRRNLLYFGPFPLDPQPIDLTREPPIPEPLPPFPGNVVTCLADNTEPLQGWSFGVGNDPKSIVPSNANIRATATQALNGGEGPDFLYLNLPAGGAGVVMAVVVDVDPAASDRAATLPAGRGHRLLNIVYQAGPEGSPGQTYAIRYTNTLGEPPVQVLFVVQGFELVPGTQGGWVSLPGPRYLRGDANGDGELDMSDARSVLDYLFLGGRTPGCLEAANANGSTQVNIADPVYALNFLFIGGPAPPFPYPFCAFAAAPLGCDDPGTCSQPLDSASGQ